MVHNLGPKWFKWYVPEVLNVHMNEIYKKLPTIKSNEKKYLNKSHFFLKIFPCLKKNLSKKNRFFFIFVHMNVQNFWHI